VLRGGDTIMSVQGGAASGPRSAVPSEHVEKVWPEAVRKVPVKGGDIEGWRPATFIDDRTLLVTAWAGMDRTGALYAYDVDSGAQRKIATVPVPEGTVSFATGFAVGGGHVVWWTATGDSVAHLWAVPLEGGVPRIVADQSIAEGDGSGIDGLAVVSDKIVFSLYAGGVFTVPLGGGTVEPVAAGAGLHLLEWPWAGTPGRGGESTGTRFGRIVNMETGETRTAVSHSGEELRSCGVTICLGTTAEGKTFFRHRDGSSQKNVPGEVGIPWPLVQDRFYVSVYGDRLPMGVGLYDLDSGKSGSLGIQGEGSTIRLPFRDATGRLLSYAIGDDLYLIDLAKIR